jgi:syntaxin of plants SYP6
MYAYMQLQETERKYRKYRTLTTANTSNTSSLQDDVEGLRYMVNEVRKSIETAARNPSRFRLTKSDIDERRHWVDSVTARIDTVSSEIWQTTRADHETYTTEDNTDDYIIKGELGQQEQIIARQDQELDVLGQHVLRIGELGRDMGQELDAQGQLLEDFGYEMQGTQTRLAAAQRKVQYVLDRAGTRGQLLIIGVLIIVLVILLFMVIQ